MTHSPRIQRALLSVSDKTGIVELAQALIAADVEILSTGGTAALLRTHSLPVLEVSDYTGFPEMMAGRVKTLHPKIHGGILGRRGTDDTTMQTHGIGPIDLIVVNLYPFQATVAQPDCDVPLAIENIDIGGPTLLRAAAKNHQDVTVIVDPSDYAQVITAIQQNGHTTASNRFQLAVKTFEHTAQYDGAIANYLGTMDAEGQRQPFAQTLNLQYRRAEILRYGENPHQQAAFYVQPTAHTASIATAQQLQGKALSYNNIADTDAALTCVQQFTQTPACVIVKHANPCGVACADSLLQAYQLAYRTDPESAFGGIIAFNQPLDTTTAQAIITQQFVEVIIAPAVTEAAQQVLAQKKNIRLLACGTWPTTPTPRMQIKQVQDGVLLQNEDLTLYEQLQPVTTRLPSATEQQDLLFAWQVAKYVKSNAIVYAKDHCTIGIGAGQMSRVNSARIAIDKANQAKLTVTGAVMASDAFFPFRDGIDQAAAAGIVAVIQPGGSKRDDEVIAAANAHNMSMLFTGTRHFRH